MNVISLEDAIKRTEECASVEFKSSFDPDKPGEWLEITKDIVALSNSGGGTIFVGLNDDGSPSGADVSSLLSVDPADVTNRLFKYTSCQFHAFELCVVLKGDHQIFAIRVEGTKVPMVFTRVGTYEPEPGKQKNAFSVGTVYFRHGAKSEPATSEDLRNFLDREIEAVRHSWLDGIAKVTSAPIGSRIAILPPESHPAGPSGSLPLRLTNDESAQPYYAVPIDRTHPFRQKEVIVEVNKRLEVRSINSHDILCIRRVYNVQKDISLCYTQNFASPRYSQAFVDWIVRQYEADAEFFEKAKVKYDDMKLKLAAEKQASVDR
jgi:hypothetical protein